jgi:hypothetical protein
MQIIENRNPEFTPVTARAGRGRVERKKAMKNQSQTMMNNDYLSGWRCSRLPQHAKAVPGKKMMRRFAPAVLVLALPLAALGQTNYDTPYTFTTLAGNGSIGSHDGTGAAAQFANPYNLAADTGGTAYVADTFNYTIRKVTTAGVVTTLAGLAGTSGTNDGTGSAARFKRIFGVAVDTNGIIYVGDTDNNTIRRVTPAGVVTTLAGLAGVRGSANGTGSAAQFYEPEGVAVGPDGNLFVADYGNHTIRKVTPAGAVTTLAGLAGSFGSQDGTGSAARFFLPFGVAVDTNGNVYVGDSGNNTIRVVTPGGAVTTIAGLGGSAGFADGTGSLARFNTPFGVVVGSDGNVFVADSSNFTIRKVTPGGVVSTVAGVPGGSGTNNGTGSATRFYFPDGVAMDGSGALYVADGANDQIRKGMPYAGPPMIGAQPADQTVLAGQSAQFTVSAFGASPLTYQWQLWSTNLTGATDSALAITNAMPSDMGPYSVVITNDFGSLSSSNAVLTVLVAVITNQPASQTALLGSVATFAVGAMAALPLSYQWTFNGTNRAGATNATLTISNVSAADAGVYAVLVSNIAGTVSSTGAVLTVPSPAALDLSSGLVLHLKFDGDYLDYSGRGNNATNMGATGFVAGKIGSHALRYESGLGPQGRFHNYVTLGLRPDLQFGSNVDFSVAYWINYGNRNGTATDVNNDLPVFGNAISSTYNPGYVFAQGGLSGGSFDWTWTLNDGSTNVNDDGPSATCPTCTNSIQDGIWHHFAATVSRSTGHATTYLDGRQVDLVSIANLSGSLDTGQPTVIGQDPSGTYPYDNYADLDDLGVWRRVLAPAEISEMYQAGAYYGASFVSAPVSITIQPLGNQIQLTWAGGLLQAAGDPGGPYRDVPDATSPFTLTPSAANKFYRIRE